MEILNLRQNTRTKTRGRANLDIKKLKPVNIQGVKLDVLKEIPQQNNLTPTYHFIRGRDQRRIAAIPAKTKSKAIQELKKMQTRQAGTGQAYMGRQPATRAGGGLLAGGGI